MNSIFVRIWLALWLVIVIVVFMSVGVFDYLRSMDGQQKGQPEGQLRSLVQDLTKAVEAGQSPASWITAVSTDERPVFLLTPEGTDIAGRLLPERFAARAMRDDGIGRPGRRGFVGEVRLDGYPPLRIIAPVHPSERGVVRWFSPEILIGLGFLVSGLAAVGLARYITFPIKQLHHASDLVAQGDFQTNVTAAVGNRKDELADLARRFDGMALALSNSQKLQQELLRDVSHELRSPLTRMLLTVNLLGEATDAERIRLESRLSKDIGELEVLVDEVMTLARFNTEAGSMTFEKRDLVETLLPVFEDAQFEASALNKSVRFNYPDEQLYANIDDVQINRAVENVVRNAIRHTPEGSEVEAKLTRANGNLLLTVTDQGDGLPETELERIFTPFYRSATAREHYAGTGVGLALAEHIVRSHHGTLSASNASEGGLLVRFKLPAS